MLETGEKYETLDFKNDIFNETNIIVSILNKGNII